ncbi:MAG: 4Fe-4S dicluster domain-containing protein [Coriobacteriales bacterium]|jgi:epoxyqueuosine reductase QueG|nr:4Fe-4S dicluster domain-containing protein [Coriobacteriales bacterium]
MSKLDELLCELLQEAGAVLVGFGDLHEVPSEDRLGLPFGVSVAIAYEPDTILGIADGPTQRYWQQYSELNERLDAMVIQAAEWLQDQGYQAVPQTRDYVGDFSKTLRSKLPHKTVATRAGLGWIGKCALLITPEYGSMIRLSSLLTDAPLAPAAPINTSRCGSCTSCADNCPAKAVSGEVWQLGLPRDEFWDARACDSFARQLAAERLGAPYALCGKCIAVCPHTQAHIKRCS